MARVLAAELLPSDTPVDVLHFAPDGVIRRLLDRPGTRYTGADLDPEPGDVEVDIQALPFGGGSYDVIVCSHVLEHVPDDRRAIAEMYRVLRAGGRAFLQHPVDFKLDHTVEDPGERDPVKRARRFGQEDHVRKYGRDIEDRVREAGFDVSIRSSRDLPDDERDRLRLEEPWEPHASGSDVYICRRPPRS